MDSGTVEVPLCARDGSVRAIALIDAEDAERVLAYRWCLHPRGYAQRGVMRGGVRRTVLLHRQIMGLGYGDRREVDHVNRNPLDCRRANLRLATRAENMQNQSSAGNRGATSSRHRGVTFRKDCARWQARAQVGKVPRYLGLFASEDEAAAAVAAWRAEHMPFSAEARAA